MTETCIITHMLTIYRVEHKETGEGPWRSAKRGDTVLLPRGCDSHPSVVSDAGFDHYSWPFALVCGCVSMTQLRHWFGTRGIVQDLADAGFHIVEYFVPADDFHPCHSGTQVAFYNDADYKVKTYPITRILTKKTP